MVAGRVSSLEAFSSSWHRVAHLKPRLRGHAQMSRHHYRGQLWYVLQDQSSRRVHRFTPAVYQVIGLMDGHRSLQEIWDVACARLGDDAPTQEEIIRMLAQLHVADVLQCEIPPDVDEMLRRQERMRGMKLLQLIMSPLSVKFPLLDPERFLNAALPFFRPFFSWFGAILWVVVVGFGAMLMGTHWSELTKDITDRALAPENLLIMWFTFPVIKLFHEFGHNSESGIIPSSPSNDVAPPEVASWIGRKRCSELSETLQEIHYAVARSVTRHRDVLGSRCGERALLQLHVCVQIDGCGLR